MPRLLCCCLLLSLTFSAWTAPLSMRRWSADVGFVRQEILVPLGDYHADAGSDFPLQIYLGSVLESLQENRDQLDPNSYLILREITLGAAENIYTFMNIACPDEPECDSLQLDKWSLLQAYLERKLDLISNVMIILD